MPTGLPLTRQALTPAGSLSERPGSAERSDAELAAAASGGDEAAFVDIVERFSPSMLRVALLHVPSEDVARELVSATWLTVAKTLRTDCPGSAMKTWMFALLVNAAVERVQKDGRLVPLAAVLAAEVVSGGPSLERARFLDVSHSEFPFHWAHPPEAWDASGLSSQETLSLVSSTIDALPEGQRAVIGLRDIDGWTPEEIEQVLQISRADQRLLLHRARAAVRQALEARLGNGSR